MTLAVADELRELGFPSQIGGMACAPGKTTSSLDKFETGSRISSLVLSSNFSSHY